MAQRLGLRESLASNDAGGTPVTDPTDPQSKNPQYDQPQSRYFQNLLSFTLGVSPVSTLEMANVAATIESDGMCRTSRSPARRPTVQGATSRCVGMW